MRRRTIRRAQQAERLTASVPSLRDSSPQTKSRMKKKFRPYFVALVICLPFSLGAQVAPDGYERSEGRGAVAKRRNTRFRARRRQVRHHAIEPPGKAADPRFVRARLQRTFRLGLRGGIRDGAGVEVVAG